jgi:hypothetical protein
VYRKTPAGDTITNNFPSPLVERRGPRTPQGASRLTVLLHIWHEPARRFPHESWRTLPGTRHPGFGQSLPLLRTTPAGCPCRSHNGILIPHHKHGRGPAAAIVDESDKALELRECRSLSDIIQKDYNCGITNDHGGHCLIPFLTRSVPYLQRHSRALEGIDLNSLKGQKSHFNRLNYVQKPSTELFLGNSSFLTGFHTVAGRLDLEDLPRTLRDQRSDHQKAPGGSLVRLHI